VDAVEIDTRVHAAIRANAAVNGVEPRLRIAATLAGLGPPPPRGYDLVVANIVAAVLDDLAAALGELTAPGGRLVISGLLAAEAPAVAERYARLCGARGSVTAEGDWRCLSFPG
jgi:ribosomal protein L11 methyltransferase